MRPIKILALLFVCAVVALGQTNKGGISGTVLDANGAAVPGATVTVTNVGTGQSQTVTSSEDGAFSVNSLDPVTYTVTVEVAGFKKSVVQSVKVDTASVASIVVQLETGAINEEVSITAEASLLNTETGTTTSTVTERQIQDVPLNNRSVLDLAVTAPNVSGDAGSEDPEVTSGQPVPGFNLSINGGRPGSTAILADGVNNTGVGIARAVVSFTPETVQEFTVQTSAYSAEFGNTGGGVINATTKSGTNDFNGVALWYMRNPVTNARQYQRGNLRPPNNLRYNQVSISAGGPVRIPWLYNGKDKTFFFFAYEPRWRRDFLTVTTLLPTAAMRAGDFTGLRRTASGFLPIAIANQFNQTSVGGQDPVNIYQQFTIGANGQLVPITLGTGFSYCQFGDTRATLNAAGQPQCSAAVTAAPNAALNVIPTAFRDPTAQQILQFLPTGGDYFLDENNLVRNYVINRFVKQDETRYTLRMDHYITNNFKANFRYTVTPAIGIRGFGSDVNGNTGVYSDAKQFLLAFNNIITPTIVNDLRLNYTSGNFSEDFSPEFSINGGRNLATELGLPSLTAGGIPLFQYQNDAGGNAFSDIGSSGSTNNFNQEYRYNLNDILYYTRGNMTWKTGVDISHARLNVTPFFAASGGRWTFRQVNTSNNRSTNVANGGSSFASLILGVPNNVDVRPLLIDYQYRWNSYAAFIQNDWKVRPNLTLNLGMRYSLQMPRYERDNLQGTFRPDLATSQTLTDAQRRAIATGLGIATTAPIPTYVPNTVTIPPFAFAGLGGRSKYITPVDYSGFEPRFGFAWSPKMKLFGLDLEKRSLVVRGGFGLSHAPLTGNNRNPNPDFGSFTTVSTTATGSSGATNAAAPVRLSTNPPLFQGTPLFTALGVDTNGLVTTNSIAVPAFAIDATGDTGKVPYSQNWNLSFSFDLFKNTIVELAYVGNKGTHLYLPFVNINPRNVDFVETLEGQGINADTTFNDPLGRRNLLGAVITIPRGSIVSPYFGFSNLNRFYDPSANSIRHAGYIDIRRRVSRGLTLTANYTYAKSIDDASDASPDTRVITEVGQTQGQVSYGAARSVDRALSTFDVKNNFSSTFIYDIPVGRGRHGFLDKGPAVLDAVIGGWSISGLFRIQGGTPFLPYLTDQNRLGGVNRTIRPNLVEGVPLRNPLWSRHCPFGTNPANNLPCEPYINPAAFARPAKGDLGNAPRTLDIRGPRQEYFDLSFQKNFKFPFADKEGKRRINFRVDLINALNHPNFRLSNSSGTAGFTGLGGNLPTETDVTAAEFASWQALDPIRANVTLAQVNGLLAASRLASGSLPLNFFSIPVPEGFNTLQPNQFDISTLQGLKLYRLRQNYDTNFGTLRAVQSPRYIQFGIRIFF